MRRLCIWNRMVWSQRHGARGTRLHISSTTRSVSIVTAGEHPQFDTPDASEHDTARLCLHLGGSGATNWGSACAASHGVDVQVSHFALMGGHGVKLGDEVAPTGAPTIHIRLVSIMGGSDVARGRKPTREERRRERELRKPPRPGLGPCGRRQLV